MISGIQHKIRAHSFVGSNEILFRILTRSMGTALQIDQHHLLLLLGLQQLPQLFSLVAANHIIMMICGRPISGH